MKGKQQTNRKQRKKRKEEEEEGKADMLLANRSDPQKSNRRHFRYFVTE